VSTPYELLSPEAREKLEGWAASSRTLLAELLEDAASDLQREFIDRAIAAGHSSAEVHAFADELRGMEDDAAFDACTLDAEAVEGYTVNQLLRAESDPLYAYELKGGALSPADEGGHDTPVTTELPLDDDDLKTPARPNPGLPAVTAPPAPAPAPARPATVSSPPPPVAAPPAAAVPSKELVSSGSTPSGTLRPMLAKDLVAGTGSHPSLKTMQAKDLVAQTQPHAAYKPSPQPPLKTMQAKDLVAQTQPSPAYRPKEHAADTAPHAAFRPDSGPQPALRPMQAKDIIGAGVTPSGTSRSSLKEAAGSARSKEVSSAGLPMAGLPPSVAGKLATRELGGAPDPMRSRSPASGPALGAAVANKLMEDALSEAVRAFGFSYRELDVDGDSGTTLEQALEQAAYALQHGAVVPVTLGPQPGQHRRFAVLMQLSVVGKNRAWQLYELASQELVWANEGDLLARAELPFSNKVNRRITRFALPNIRPSDF